MINYLNKGTLASFESEGEMLKRFPEGLPRATDKDIDAIINPAETIEEKTALASAECSKRINEHWNQIGQINASLGIYGADDTAACSAWISSNRAALVALLAREDLLKIDVTSDEHWPVFEDAGE